VIAKAPLKKVISDKEQRKRFLLALIIMTGLLYSYYTSIGFMPTFLEKYVKINKNEVAAIPDGTAPNDNWGLLNKNNTYQKTFLCIDMVY
jgi:hypothetical protein